MSNRATALFIPHGGGPLPLLGDPGHAAITRFLQDWPASIDKPDAIIVISAHWEEPVVSITASESPALLFDYGGFPPETYEYQYPAPGNPALAARAHGLLQQAGIDSNLEYQRGYDHGMFVPLMLMYPEADIPCIQVSLSASLDAGEHLRIGRSLAGLKRENLLILGSGFSFHNMQALMPGVRRLAGADLQRSRFICGRTRSTPGGMGVRAARALLPSARGAFVAAPGLLRCRAGRCGHHGVPATGCWIYRQRLPVGLVGVVLRQFGGLHRHQRGFAAIYLTLAVPDVEAAGNQNENSEDSCRTRHFVPEQVTKHHGP
jgi:hypothetical protein